jgi:Holliday junction resolvasome RuvABC endonuclease subunit
MKRLLSFDLSTVGTGWAFFRNDELKESGTIEAKGDIQEKLKVMHRGLNLLFQRWIPDTVVSEAPAFVQYRKRSKQYFLPGIEPTPKFNGNPDVFIKLCKLHGILLSICIERDLLFEEISNLKKKKQNRVYLLLWKNQKEQIIIITVNQ